MLATIPTNPRIPGKPWRYRTPNVSWDSLKKFLLILLYPTLEMNPAKIPRKIGQTGLSQRLHEAPIATPPARVAFKTSSRQKVF